MPQVETALTKDGFLYIVSFTKPSDCKERDGQNCRFGED